METTYAVEMRGICKSFGSVVANQNVNLRLKRGHILSLLGENGSGKTTLMNMLSGIYFPDEGEILVNGKVCTIASPKDAFDLGIGMIHQHFKLVDVLTAAENVVLGLREPGRFDRQEVVRRVREISERYGFELDPTRKIYNLSVSEKQTVEILKVLYRGADILVLDEPTAVLTPQETERLFAVLRRMREDGKAIILITHKLSEVLAISDEVAVMRRGEHIATVPTKDATAQSLTEMMVGRRVELNIQRTEMVEKHERLRVDNLSYVNREGIPMLKNVSFEAYSGEILGIAGVAGSGQKELLESIAGLHHVAADSSILFTAPEEGAPRQLIGCSPQQIRRMGVALSFVPEDRLGMGLVADMGMTDNMMLKTYQGGVPFFVDRRSPKKLAEQIVEELEVVTPDVSTPVRRLSGGNVQKVLVGREIAAAPAVLMAAYPVRGLDINASYTIYNLLNQQKERGVAVIYVGEDLDVLLALCDRILVLCGGQISGVVDAHTATKEEIGLMMTRVGEEGAL